MPPGSIDKVIECYVTLLAVEIRISYGNRSALWLILFLEFDRGYLNFLEDLYTAGRRMFEEDVVKL